MKRTKDAGMIKGQSFYTFKHVKHYREISAVQLVIAVEAAVYVVFYLTM